MRIVLRRGLNVGLKGVPDQQSVEEAIVERVGLTGHDLGLIRAEVLVETGQPVLAGTPILRDRKRPELVFVSPVSGAIEAIERGARRRLSEITIAKDGSDDVKRFDVSRADTESELRQLLLTSGQWPALRARPFERIADPQASPAALFVTAIDTTSHAPDPARIIKARSGDFARGVDALSRLVDGPVFVCQPDTDPFVTQAGNLRVVRFAGRHPAGLVGTHIAKIFTPDPSRIVWHIGYQDVIAIGHLLETGTIDPSRTISLSGPGLRTPRLVRVPLGADLHSLARPDLCPGPKKIVSGSVLLGFESPFLARYHLQSVVLERKGAPRQHWLIEALRKAQRPAPFIPTLALEQALGTDAPVVPLLRALSIGDAEAAQRLGCLYLAEDDLALASYVTGGQTDFGARLRNVLDTLEEEGA